MFTAITPVNLRVLTCTFYAFFVKSKDWTGITESWNQWILLFDPYFNSVRMLHNCNTRWSSKMTYVVPKVRTNYGTFNIGFQGAKVWNDESDDKASSTENV